jgi:hypothetical protein
MGGYPSSLALDGEASPEAPEEEPQASQTYVIDFGCAIPFTKIPDLIEEGFQASRRLFINGNPKVLAHYEAARDCLEECLGDPLCDVLLMIVLTFASSTDTPTLPIHSHKFRVGPRKDPSILAITLATRMLWFLCPQSFPWDKDDGMVLCISEMTKKIGSLDM